MGTPNIGSHQVPQQVTRPAGITDHSPKKLQHVGEPRWIKRLNNSSRACQKLKEPLLVFEGQRATIQIVSGVAHNVTSTLGLNMVGQVQEAVGKALHADVSEKNMAWVCRIE